MKSIEDGELVSISAQNDGKSGDLKVSIWTDGIPLKTATSKGAFSIAVAKQKCCTVE